MLLIFLFFILFVYSPASVGVVHRNPGREWEGVRRIIMVNVDSEQGEPVEFEE